MRHRCNKSRSINVRIFEHAAELPQDWNLLLPKGHFLHSDQLGIYEQMQLPDLSFRYVLLTIEGKAVAAGYFQVLSIKEKHLKVQQPVWSRLWKLFTALRTPRLLIAGHLFRHDICSWHWDASLTIFQAYKLYQKAISKALRHACADAVLVKDVANELIPYFQHYAPQYLLLRNDISMEMEIPPEWHTLQQYEKALKHKYAQRFRKLRQPWEDLQVRELSLAETIADKQTLFQLYQQVSRKQTVRLGMLSEDFLPLLKANYPHQLHIWMVYEREKPVAFFSAWTRDATFDMFYIGFDYDHNEALQLYFNILFSSLEMAIFFNKERLILGRTALEAKARLGCKAKYLSTFLFVRNRVLRSLLHRLQQNVISQEGEWENRHPLKA